MEKQNDKLNDGLGVARMTKGEWRGRYRSYLMKFGLPPLEAMDAALMSRVDLDTSPEQSAYRFLKQFQDESDDDA